MPHTVVERRLAVLQAWIVGGLVFMLVTATSALGVGVWVVQNSKAQADEALACYVLPQIERSKKSLPTVEYYKTHPDELKKALDQIDEQRDLALATWGDCDKDEITE